MRGTFVERWYRDGDAPLEVFFVDELARFEVRAAGDVVFTSAAFVEVLRWCMHGPDARETVLDHDQPDALDISPWDERDG